jgi:hypothetical protein
MMTKYLVPIALLGLCASASARPDHRMMGRGPDMPRGPMLLKVAQMVGLSADQVSHIRQISLASEKEAIPLESKLRMAQLELQEAMEGDTPPAEKKVLGLVDRVGWAELQLKKNHVLMMLRIRGTMNKAQWDKLQVLHAEHQGLRPPGGPGGMMPPGPPPGAGPRR